MEFSVNTVVLYPGLGMEDTVRAAMAHGYQTFETWRVGPDDVREMARLEKEYGIRFSTVLARASDLNDPKRHAAYLSALEELLEELKVTSCRTVITQVGQDTGAPRKAQHDAIVKGLKAAVPILERYGTVLLVEPLNTVRDHMGYYLSSSDEGFEIIRGTGSPHVRLLFDVYHQLQMGEDVIPQIRDHLDLIAHFHIAGIPERDELLFTGTVDYRPILEFIRDSGTKAPVGVELFPVADGASDRVLEELKAFL